jgi:hypothetical protein
MHDILLPASKTARFLQAYRHPDQAAIAARLPAIGRRVPMRAYWRNQHIDRNRIARKTVHNLDNFARTAAFSASMGARTLARGAGARAAARRAERRLARHEHHVEHMPSNRVARAWSTRPRLGFPMLVVGAALGALLMYVFDPAQGRRRRALVRDRLAHMRRVVTRDVPYTVEKRGRFFRGVARGIAHDTVDALPFNGHPLADNETLVARVRSEVLRDDHIKAGEIHVDAYEGCVTLRGQLPHPDEIKRLVRDTAHVEGVREVRNFLHLPGTPPPNKAAVYMRWDELPATRTRA